MSNHLTPLNVELHFLFKNNVCISLSIVCVQPKGKWECPACTGQKFEQPLISSVQSAVVVGTKRGCRARQTKRAKKECVR